jgi:nitrate reductase (cytochrome), electron transfer subunit
MATPQIPRIPPLAAAVVISVAVVGYFVGLQSPMNPTTADSATTIAEHVTHLDIPQDSPVVPATAYSEMAALTARLGSSSTLQQLKSDIDPLAEVKIEPGDKHRALAERGQNRAFNGAPPTIPHPIEQMSSATCVACHGDGVKTASLRVSRMSHQFLASCTQCHVESASQYMAAEPFRENEFVGIEAPYEGPRAYAGAPPQIPHSTWMRSDCMSCHGYAGLQGIRTTHPWRQNCQQCHAPSAELDQTLLAAEPQFLPPPPLSN